MKPTLLVATAFFLALTVIAPARADICSEHRAAIDVLIAESTEIIALNDTLDAVRKGMRAARTARTALKTLGSESSRRILEMVDALASDQLGNIDPESIALIEAFETVYKKIKAASDDLSSARTEKFDAARIAANAAAESTLDSLAILGAVPRRGALKAASASAAASPRETTSNALISVHESIFRAACE